MENKQGLYTNTKLESLKKKKNNGTEIVFKIIQEKFAEKQKTLAYNLKHSCDNCPRKVNFKIYLSKSIRFQVEENY